MLVGRLTIVPAHATAIVDVRVITAHGGSGLGSTDHFLYEDAQSPVTDASASVGRRFSDTDVALGTTDYYPLLAVGSPLRLAACVSVSATA